jgi:hypothetical protein
MLTGSAGVWSTSQRSLKPFSVMIAHQANLYRCSAACLQSPRLCSRQGRATRLVVTAAHAAAVSRRHLQQQRCRQQHEQLQYQQSAAADCCITISCTQTGCQARHSRSIGCMLKSKQTSGCSALQKLQLPIASLRSYCSYLYYVWSSN